MSIVFAASLLIGCLVLFAFLTWRSLEWGIYTIFLLLPTYLIRFSIGPLPSTFLEALILELFVIFLIKKRSELSELLRTLLSDNGVGRNLWIAAGAVIISATISVITSSNTMAALGIWKAYFIEPVLFSLVLTTVIKKKEQIRNVLIALTVSGISIALVTFYQKIIGIGIPGHVPTDIRATSVYGYPNGVGMYLGPIVVFCLPIFIFISQKIHSRSWRLVMHAIVVVIVVSLLLAMVFSESTAALGATLCALFFYFLFSGKVARRASIVLGVGAVLLILILPGILPTFEKRILLNDWSGKVRKITWSESVNMLRDKWLTGAGLAGYRSAMEPYHKATYIEIFLYPHNNVLNVWSETGLYGLVSFLILLVIVMSMLIKACRRYAQSGRREEYAISLTLLCVLIQMGIQGLVDVPYFKNDLSVLFWTIVTLAYVMHVNSRERIDKKEVYG